MSFISTADNICNECNKDDSAVRVGSLPANWCVTSLFSMCVAQKHGILRKIEYPLLTATV